jgi:hypothetical protein
MGWDGVQLTRYMKGYMLCNNKGNVTFGEVMRMHEEDRRDQKVNKMWTAKSCHNNCNNNDSQ